MNQFTVVVYFKTGLFFYLDMVDIGEVKNILFLV